MHGAEGVLSIAPVRTPQMGAALAWISAGSQLTFGSLQLEPGLHWYTLGELTLQYPAAGAGAALVYAQ